jgi:Fe2+ transport system protein FeoA
MSVWELDKNQIGIISNIEGNDKISMRLIAMGFIIGQNITILQKDKRSSLVKVGETRVALSSHLLENVKVA